jgi:hypothetical protein
MADSTPVIKVRFIKPGDKVEPPKRSSPNEAGLRHNTSELSSIKHLLEEIFGQPTWYKLKETGSIRTWKTETARLLRAIDLSIKSTVEISDDQWRRDMAELIADGIKRIDRAKYIDELLSDLAATLTRIVFLQIGLIPSHYGASATLPLVARNWTLKGHRSVQYVQNDAQRAAVKAEQERLAENKRRVAEQDASTER